MFLLFKIALAIVSPLHFQVTLRISLPISGKSQIGFYRYCTEYVDQFGAYRHFDNVSLPIREHGMSFHSETLLNLPVQVGSFCGCLTIFYTQDPLLIYD